MLNYLLTQEIYEDEENKVREQSDLLGGVQRNLIKSITAISAPHNGTTLNEVVTKTIPSRILWGLWVHNFIILIWNNGVLTVRKMKRGQVI